LVGNQGPTDWSWSTSPGGRRCSRSPCGSWTATSCCRSARGSGSPSIARPWRGSGS